MLPHGGCNVMIVIGVDAVKYVTCLLGEAEQLQPAGIDLTVGDVRVFEGSGRLSFKSRTLPKTSSVPMRNGVWDLKPGCYQVVYNEVIRIPGDCAGIVLPRSSLLRLGADLRSALWDPGYVGRGIGLLIVLNPMGLRLEENARIGQLVLIRLERKPHKLYDGSYQYENIGVSK